MRKLTKSKARVVSPAKKERVLLAIIDAMGGDADVSEFGWHWISWFCDDEKPGGDDTFNRCIQRGWLRSTHDSDTDCSTAYITEAGRKALEESNG